MLINPRFIQKCFCLWGEKCFVIYELPWELEVGKMLDSIMSWFTGGSMIAGIVAIVAAIAIHQKWISVGSSWKTWRFVAGALGILLVLGGTSGISGMFGGLSP